LGKEEGSIAMAAINGVKEVAISLPFRFSEYGKIADTTDSPKIWGDKVRSAIGTMMNERVMLPRYGSKIPTHVLNNQAELADRIDSEVHRVFNEYLPALTLESVKLVLDEGTGTFSADVVYALPNDAVVSTNVGFASISGTSPLTEEML
jgi:phage baseplate assembly protein W